jgi:hypothetical protein
MVLTVFESFMDDIMVKRMVKLKERSVEHVIGIVAEELSNTAT